MSDQEILTELRIAVGRIETRQLHILEVLTEHKAKVSALERLAHSMQGRVWLVSTVVFATLAAAWEIIKTGSSATDRCLTP